MPRAAGTPSVTSNALLVTEESPLELKTSVYPAPTLFNVRLLKVAIPVTASIEDDNVPVSVAEPGLVPTTAVANDAAGGTTRLPSASCASTCNAGVMLAPAGTLDGWTVIANFV